MSKAIEHGLQMLTVAEVAAMLGLKEATVRAWLIQGRISYCKLGKSVRIDRQEVCRILHESLVPARAR